ncbi:hypothetical protein PAPYR_492 [Paratrimastix pyriformis]|uniref:Uncharacterized protein n=1 Tax=Paratrimastix pyriformis TaxID=342808 RepID=A0ABQ8UTR6_9EUKA|nr:hypothetical protein PAPYR_492 [Paratrimastix pyriformis]
MEQRRVQKKIAKEIPADEVDLWVRLPPELLRTIVEASPHPLHVYVQLLGLSHAIRTRIRGTPHELSFDEPPDILPTITPDPIAALVGPCKSIRSLSFLKISIINVQEGPTAGSWVDEAFGEHNQLARLTLIPPLSEPVVERILSRLPGLVELTVDTLLMSTRLLAALARSCPCLQVLQCSVSKSAPLDFAALAPLSGVLRELVIRGVTSSEESLAALVCSLSAVTSLKLPRCCCPSAALEPIASHLTTLELDDDLREEKNLPGPWLCRLVAPLARLLAANQATLHRLRLKLFAPDAAKLAILIASLRALPHLIHLDFQGCSISALPPDLLDRLERLSITSPTGLHPLRIASNRLQQLCLRGQSGPPSELALHCPALVDRHREPLPVPAQSLDGVDPMPMPDLENAAFSGGYLVDPAWLLTGSPRLRVLSDIHLTRPDLLARLCAFESLVHLVLLNLNAARLPNPLVLRLPHLERLGLNIEETDCTDKGEPPLPPPDLQVEAPELLDFSLAIIGNKPGRAWLRNCPHLVSLWLNSSALLSFQADEDETVAPAAMQPRFISVVFHLDADSLLALLTRHGARLCDFSLAEGLVEYWPRLMGALSGLPRLASLTLDVSGAPSPLSLACPQLRTLFLRGLSDETKVVLACPLLEELWGIKNSSQLELTLPAPNLRTLF